MATNQNQSPLFVGDGDDSGDDLDNISTTSTIDPVNDEDAEYVVDAILAERPSQDREGEMQYLIKWEDYPMEQSTWEPCENLSDELHQKWKEQKEDERAGRLIPFDIQIYYSAIENAERLKAVRHNRRNEKRRRLGIPLTEPYPIGYEDESDAAKTKGDSESDEEAMELDDTDPERAEKTPAQKAIKETTFKGITSSKPASLQAGDAMSKLSPSRHSSSTSSLQQSDTQALGRIPSATGYQGTARRVSSAEQNTTRPVTSNSKPSSVKPTSNLANKFKKRLTATRTHQPPKPLVARPASGSGALAIARTRKKRTNLREAMVDPTKPAKLFNKLSMRNQLKKKSGELNDAAPADPSSIPSNFIITGDQPKKTQSHDQPKAQPSNESVPDGPISRTISMPSAIAPPTGPKRDRKGKSVRFLEDSLVDEPMDLDSPSSVSDAATQGTNTDAPIKRQKLSLQAYSERATSQDVSKRASFGPKGSQEVLITLSNIPKRNDPWLSQFLAEQSLHFCHMCISADFRTQHLYKPENRLAGGIINSTSDAPALENVAAHLRETSSALVMMRAEYCILVYPSKCDSWQGLSDPSSPSEAALSHLTFKCTLEAKHRPLLTEKTMAQVDDNPSGPLICVELMKRLCSLDYNTLLPRQTGKDVFFLLCYPAEQHLFRTIALWLRKCQPECHILISLPSFDGSWNRFLGMTSHGAVIMHGTVTKSIRKIPRLWEALKQGATNFWSLSWADNEQLLSSVSESMLRPAVTAQSPLRLHLSQLLPYGRVFLITPSFAISQPARLCEFLDWFKARVKNKNPGTMLVACANFPEYLRDLAVSKAAESDLLRQSRLDTRQYDDGLSERDNQARIRAWEMMSELVNEQRGKFRLYELDEDIRKTVWADELIDPNDEQSLVNWYAWWATEHMCQYRRFYVIGSGTTGTTAAHRMVRVPNYAEYTAKHPDLERELVAQSQAASEGDSVSTPIVSPATAIAPSVPQSFRSAIFNNDKASEFREWLRDFTFSRRGMWSYALPEPVSWLNTTMADHFGDGKCSYATFTTWLYGAPPRFTRSINTWVGFFYTIDASWREGQSDVPSARRPWIAIYRPVNPHLNTNPYAAMELLLWDHYAVNNLPDVPTSDNLLWMQRQLIEFVRKEVPKKTSGCYLDRVFIGDFAVPDENAISAVDVTIRSIECMMGDGKRWLPPFEKAMHVRGWKQVSVDSVNQPTTGFGNAAVFPPTLSAQVEEFPKIEADRSQKERIIFHPPAAKRPMGLCNNALYEKAFEARKRDPNCNNFLYHYRTTLDWYHELKQEGRAYNHIHVDSWDRIFSDPDLRISNDNWRL